VTELQKLWIVLVLYHCHFDTVAKASSVIYRENLPMHCYGQSWYKYCVRIVIYSLICRDLRDRVVSTES